MSVFDTLTPAQPTAEQGALRVKRTLAQVFQQVEIALSQVRQIINRHGVDNIQLALGNEAAEVEMLYGALKSIVEQYKPGASIPDLPKQV